MCAGPQYARRDSPVDLAPSVTAHSLCLRSAAARQGAGPQWLNGAMGWLLRPPAPRLPRTTRHRHFVPSLARSAGERIWSIHVSNAVCPGYPSLATCPEHPPTSGHNLAGPYKNRRSHDPMRLIYCRLPCRGGGTGRRAGLKIRWWQHRVGSIPTLGTILSNALTGTPTSSR